MQFVRQVPRCRELFVGCVNTNKPELLKLQEELPSLSKAKCIILDTLTNQLDEWSDQLDVVNDILADLSCKEKTCLEVQLCQDTACPEA